jgi:hypothetical protein
MPVVWMLCVFEMPLYAQWRRLTLDFPLYSVRAAGGIVENADYNKLPLICGMFHTYSSDCLFRMIIFMTNLAARANLCHSI